MLETNKEHVDVVITHKQATDYLEKNYPSSKIMVSGFPLDRELTKTFGTYVTKPLDIEFFNKTKLRTDDGIDVFYYSPQSSNIKDIPERTEEFNLHLIEKFESNNKTAYIFEVY